MRKLTATVLLIAFASAGLANDALANCAVVGTIVATQMGDDGKGSSSNRVFVRRSAFADHTFSFTTGDQDVVLVAVIAKSSQMEVTITGDAASCPGSGVDRDGGQILQLDLNT